MAQTVLFSENINNNWDIYSINPINGEVDRITKDSFKDFQSDYCISNNNIVFDSYRDKNSRNIFSLNLKTNELLQLTQLETRDGHPVWSPDCHQIAFQSSRNGGSNVYIMNSKGENIEQLTFNGSFDGIPKWSPNGKYIGFNSSRTGSPNVFLLNIKTKELKQMTGDEQHNFIQDWLSDNQLLIITDESKKRQMQILDIKVKATINVPTEFDVTYARTDKNRNIVFIQKNNKEEEQLYLMALDDLVQKQLTNTKGEKRFPAFMHANGIK